MRDFVAFAAANGVVIDALIADGRRHRTATANKPSKRNAWYKYDGKFGWVLAFDSGGGQIFFESDEPADPVKVAQFRQQAASERDEQETIYARAAIVAKEVVARCRYDDHPYFGLKDLHGEKGLVDPHDGRLVVPMREWRTGELQTVQWINDLGEKRFMPHGRAKGAVFGMGPMMARCLAVEGFATGHTVIRALKLLYRQDRVVVVFSAGNLRYVAEKLGAGTVVIADNDKPDHSGHCAGQEAAAATGLPWVMSPVPGEDVNDMASRAGLPAVADLIRNLR